MPEVWPHAPRTIREILSFDTDVRKHPAGEYRDSLRIATQNLSLGYARADAEAARMYQRFKANVTGEWYVPLWQDCTFFSGSITGGQTTFSVNTDADYQAGKLAFFYKSDTEWFTGVIVSATGGTLTIAGSPAADAMTGPLLIAPMGTFICPQGMTNDREFGYERPGLIFLRTDGTDLGDLGSLQSFYGSPVITEAGVVVQALDGGISQALDLIENDFGGYAIETNETYARKRSMLSFSDSDQTARWTRRRLLHYLRGRDKAFWLPTYKQDLTVTNGTATTTQDFAEQEWPDINDLVGQYLYFTEAENTLKQIAGVSLFLTNLRVTLDATPGYTVTTAARVSFATLMRLDSDRIEIDHRFTGEGFLSTCRVNAVEVPA